MTEAFLGRQPIFDRDLELHAFELLYRGADVDFADFVEGDRATAQVLLDVLTDFGMDRVVGAHPAFVNLTRGFVIGEYPLPVPNERVVLEVLEEVSADDEVLAGLDGLRAGGHTIALDDFVLCDENEGLLAHADIIKVDVQGLGAREIRAKVELLRPFGARLLAEKIETRSQLEVCREVGFELLQGYYLARPRVLRTDVLPVGRETLVRLLAEMREADPDPGALVGLVAGDATLAYRLLRMVRAQPASPEPVRSLAEAVERVGLEGLASLAALILLCDLEDAPEDLLLSARFRADLTTRLALAAGHVDPERHRLVGLLSGLEGAPGIPLERLLEGLPLDEEVQAALRHGSGVLAGPLRAVRAYEHGDWEAVGALGLRPDVLRAALHDAVRRAEGPPAGLPRAA